MALCWGNAGWRGRPTAIPRTPPCSPPRATWGGPHGTEVPCRTHPWGPRGNGVRTAPSHRPSPAATRPERPVVGRRLLACTTSAGGLGSRGRGRCQGTLLPARYAPYLIRLPESDSTRILLGVAHDLARPSSAHASPGTATSSAAPTRTHKNTTLVQVRTGGQGAAWAAPTRRRSSPARLLRARGPRPRPRSASATATATAAASGRATRSTRNAAA